MEGALVVGAVAEEGHHDLASLHLLRRQGSPHRDGNAAADDAVGAQIALGDIGNVHGAATAPAVARGLAEELGEHALHVGALGDAMAVAAMGGGDLVILGQRHADAGGARLLPDGQVHGAVDEAAHVALLRAFLEAADEIHLAQHLLQLLRRIMPVGKRQVGMRIIGDLAGRGHGQAPASP